MLGLDHDYWIHFLCKHLIVMSVYKVFATLGVAAFSSLIYIIYYFHYRQFINSRVLSNIQVFFLVFSPDFIWYFSFFFFPMDRLIYALFVPICTVFKIVNFNVLKPSTLKEPLWFITHWLRSCTQRIELWPHCLLLLLLLICTMLGYNLMYFYTSLTRFFVIETCLSTIG